MQHSHKNLHRYIPLLLIRLFAIQNVMDRVHSSSKWLAERSWDHFAFKGSAYGWNEGEARGKGRRVREKVRGEGREERSIM